MRKGDEKMMRRKKLFGLLITICLMLAMWTMPACGGEKIPFDIVEKVWWDEYDNGLVRWDKVEKAGLYEVLLYKEQLIVKRMKVSTNKVNLLEYMEDDALYTVSVRAVPKSSQKTYSAGEWAYSDELIATGIGDTSGRFRTYREGSKYQLEDGTYVQNQWKLIETCWYYFDAAGYMQTGWQQINGKWYYLGTDGKMQTGWIQLDGSWYYLQADGAMYSGWVEYQPGQWYYLDTDGRMLADTVVDGYQLDASGLRIN